MIAPKAPRAPFGSPAEVLVIGAGLAGMATASALGEAEIRSVVIGSPAVTAASAVPLALMAPYPTCARDPLTRLRNRGARATRAWLARLEAAGLDSGRRIDQVLLIPGRVRDRGRRDRLVPGDRAFAVSPRRAHALTGVLPPETAVLHPDGACIDPTAFIHALHRAQTPRIRYLEAEVAALDRHRGYWRAHDAAGEPIAAAPVVIVAAGMASARFSVFAADRLTAVRGQATAFSATERTRQQRRPVSQAGYVLPALEGVHWVGATATRNDPDPHPRADDDDENAERLRALWPGLTTRAVARFVAIRATTRNRLPLVGPIGEGMWLNTGHGSHGLQTAPLAGRTIARAIARATARRTQPLAAAT